MTAENHDKNIVIIREGVGIEEGHKPADKPISELRKEVTATQNKMLKERDKGDSL